jgi:hypothetical protein
MPRILDYILKTCMCGRLHMLKQLVNGSNIGKKVEARKLPLLSMVYK